MPGLPIEIRRMKRLLRPWLAGFTLLAGATAQTQAQAPHALPRVVIDEALNGKTAGRIEGAGEFVAGGGWRTQGGLLIFDAGRAIEEGYFEATVSGMTFPSWGADKSSMFSGWEGNSFDPGKEQGSFWHWRTGSQDVLKALAAPDGPGTRRERGFGPDIYRRLNDGQPHRFRVAWQNGRVEFAVDGEVLHAFQFPRMSLRYFTIGKERGGAGAQITRPAPIVSDVRVVEYPSKEPTHPPATDEVLQRAIFERSFTHTGDWANPYRDVTATVVFERWRGAGPVRLPLFWDGGKTWRFRFSPNAPGRWTWRVESNDRGPDGQHGVFRCLPSTLEGGTVADGLQFLTERGGEFWPLGDLNWSAYATNPATGLNRETLERYLDVRARQGFNLILANLLGIARNEGGPAFTDLAAEQLNPAYWQEVEHRVQAMNQRKMLALLALAAAAPHPGRPGDVTWADFPNDEARLRYATHVLARLGVYNVALALAAEWDGNEAQAQMLDRIGEHLHALNAHQRILTVHTAWPPGPTGRFTGRRWNALADFAADYDNLHADAFNPRSTGKVRLHGGFGVYLLDQDGDGKPDFHNSTSLDAIRHAAWDVVMSHCVLVTAFAPTYDGGRGHAKGFVVNDPAMNAWAEQLGHIHRFFHSVLPERNPRGGWHWLRTANRLATFRMDDRLTLPVPRTGDVRSPEGVITPPVRTAWVLSKDGYGVTTAVYFRGYTNTATIRLPDAEYPEVFMTNAPTPVFALRLFNPRTGEVSPLPEQRGNAPLHLTPPTADDWVFAIRRTNPWVPEGYSPGEARRTAATTPATP